MQYEALLKGNQLTWLGQAPKTPADKPVCVIVELPDQAEPIATPKSNDIPDTPSGRLLAIIGTNYKYAGSDYTDYYRHLEQKYR